MPRLSHDDLCRSLAFDDDRDGSPHRGGRPAALARPRSGAGRDGFGAADAPPRSRPHARPHERKPFRCGRCRVMVEAPPSGGRHRNHCPRCLTSRHVDRGRPGDRESNCRALMPAVGTAFRPDGEQLVVHRCNGCGAVRRCRVAADDEPATLLRLPPHVLAEEGAEETEEVAIA